MKLKNLMTTQLHAVSVGATTQEAAQVMAYFQVDFLPVLRNGVPVGVVTVGDITRRVIARGLDPRTTRVRDFMSSEPISIDEEAEVEDAAVLMRKHQVKHLPVCRPDRTLSGIFTLSDLALHWRCAEAGEVMRRIAEPKGRPGPEKEQTVSIR